MDTFEKCKYKLPCGWCDRKNTACSMNDIAILNQDHLTVTPLPYITPKPINTDTDSTCIHDWYVDISDMTSISNIVRYRCRKCGMIQNDTHPIITCQTQEINNATVTLRNEITGGIDD